MRTGVFRIIIEGDDHSAHFDVIEQFVKGLLKAEFASREEILEHLVLFGELEAETREFDA